MSSPSLSDHSLPPSPLSPEPEAGHDPGNLNERKEDFHGPPVAPISNPTADMDDLSDNDSILSDVDEAQFEDFDPNQIAIEERPIAVDEDTVKLLGRHKRKRDAEVDGEGLKKKKKEGKREKTKKVRKRKGSDDDDFSGGQELEGKRIRKKKALTEDGEKVRKEKPRAKKAATPENDEELDPEERKCTISAVAVF